MTTNEAEYVQSETSEPDLGGTAEPRGEQISLTQQAGDSWDLEALDRMNRTRSDSATPYLPEIAQPKTPQLDGATLERTAEELNDALTKGGRDQGRDKVLRILGPLTAADRRALEQVYEEKYGDRNKAAVLKRANDDTSGIDHSSDFQNSALRDALKARFGGADNVDFRRAESLLNKADGKTNDAGALMVAIKQSRQDPERGNVAMRTVFQTLNKEQIDEMEANFKRDYGKTWQEAVAQAGKVITPQTKEALDVYKRGSDYRRQEDVVKLARLAVETKDGRLFAEVLRGDSPAAVAARRELTSNKDFIVSAIKAFPSPRVAHSAGSQRFQRVVDLADPKGNFTDKSGRQRNLTEFLDPAGRDYLLEGRVSLKTITTTNTDSWLFSNEDNISLAARNADDTERRQYTAGRKLAMEGRSPRTEEEKQAADYYKTTSDTFKERGNPRQVAIWEDQLIHGRETIVSQMAKTHSDGWLGIGKGHSAHDLMTGAENLSEKGWETLRDPDKGPDFRRQIDESLKTFATDEQRARIMKMLDEKAAKGTYAESKTVRRPVLEVIEDNEGSAFLYMGTSYDTRNILAGFASMSPADAQRYKTDDAYRARVDQFVETQAGFDSVEKLLAKRMLEKVRRTGEPPKMDSLDQFLNSFINNASPSQQLILAHKALREDPALRARLSGSDRLSESDEALHRAFTQAYIKGRSASSGVRDFASPHDVRRASEQFLRTGELSLQDKARFGIDKSMLIMDAANASVEDRDSIRRYLTPVEQRVMDSAAANGGRLTMADRVAMLSLGHGDYKEFRAELEAMRRQPNGFVKLQQLKDEFSGKYGRNFDEAFLSKVDERDRNIYKDLITPTNSDGRQTFYENVWKALRSDSGYSPDGTGPTLQRSVDKAATALEDYQRVYQTLPPEKQRALDEYFNQAFEEHKQSKEKLAEVVFTAAVTAAALAAIPFTFGASGAALSAYAGIAASAGAGLNFAVKDTIIGNDYNPSVGDAVKGAVAGALIFAMPPISRVTGVFGGGARTALADANVAGRMTGMQAAEREGLERGLTESLMQNGKNFSERQALGLVQRTAPSLSADAQQALAREIAESVGRNYGSIERGIAALGRETQEKARSYGARQFARDAGANSAIGGGGNAVAAIAEAPFNPGGLDASSLVTQTLIGAGVGGIVPVLFRGAIEGKRYLLNVSKEVDASSGAQFAVVHSHPDGKPVTIRRVDGSTETVNGRTRLRDGDQIVDGPEAPATARAQDRNARQVVPQERPPIRHTELTPQQVDDLWRQQANGDGVFAFQKGFYEARIKQVDAKEHPNGLIFSTSEKSIKLQSDVRLPDGKVLKAGTELPNGVQMSPGEIHVQADGTRVLKNVRLLITPEDGVRMPDGSILRGGRLENVHINEGADAQPGQWIVQRNSTDDGGNARLDTYALTEANKAKRWVPVEGKSGVYAPNIGNAGPVEMVRIPDGMHVRFMASYGEDAANSGPAWLVRDGNGYYIVTERDLRETYIGASGASELRMRKILDDASGRAGYRVPSAMRPDGFAPAHLDLPHPTQEYIKTSTVQARMIDQDGFKWTNHDAAPGHQQQVANRGDWLISPPDGGPKYVADGKFFRENYHSMPGFPGRYAKSVGVRAQVLHGPASVRNPKQGTTSGDKGDYLITETGGNQYIVPKGKFEGQYAPREGRQGPAEPMNLPPETSPATDIGRGHLHSTWEKGDIIRDTVKDRVLVTNTETGEFKLYESGRLIEERRVTPGPDGTRLTRTHYPYRDIESVSSLPDAQEYNAALLNTKYGGSTLGEVKDRAMHIPDTLNDPSIDKVQRAVLQRNVTERRWDDLVSGRDQTAIDQALGTPQREKKARIVMGLPGSGKTSTAMQDLRGQGFMVLESDEIKKMLPEYRGGVGANALRNESNQLNDKLLDRATREGYNFVLTGVGTNADWIKSVIRNLHADGWQVDLVFVDIPPVESMRRVVSRFQDEGRFVDPGFLVTHGHVPADNYRKLVDELFTNGRGLTSHRHVWNYGNRPVTLEEGRIE